MESKQPQSIQENVFTQFGRLWSGVDSRRMLGGCAAAFGVALLFLAWHSSGDNESNEFEDMPEESPEPVPLKKKRKKSQEQVLPPQQSGYAAIDDQRAPVAAPNLPPPLRAVNFSSIRANLDFVDDGPCHIYSQVIDDNTHNIIFFSVPDWRSHVPVEPVNITHTSRTVEDFLDLGGVNKYGQTLAYRIIVKDKKVLGVLMQDRGVRKMEFVEHKVPEEGDIVEVTFDGSIGIVKCVPISMIVTNRDPGDDPITEKEIEYNRGRRPKGRYFEELHGYIDLEIVRIHGNWKKAPVLEANHVTYLKPADPTIIDQYYSWRTEEASVELDTFDTEYISLIDNLQNLFDFAGEEPPDEGTFSKIQADWKRCEEISSKVSDECLHKTKELAAQIKANIIRTHRRRRLPKMMLKNSR